MKQEVLTQVYDRRAFQRFVTDFLPEDYVPEERDVALTGRMNFTSGIRRLGRSKTLEMEVFEFRHSSLNDARVGICKDAFSTLLHQSNHNRALVAFVPADGKQWRLSLLEMEAEINDKSNRIKRNYSNPRRYSFILGVGAKVKTPTQFIIEGGRITEKADRSGKPMTAWEDLKSRFSVEVLTNDFYTQLYRWFLWAIDENSGVYFPNDVYTTDDDFDRIPERIIRLITRLLFVWFIKQKELIPNEIFSRKELQAILRDFDAESRTDGTYYNAILQNLFFATLNQEVDKRAFINDYKKIEEKWSVKDLYRDDTRQTYFNPDYGHKRILHLFHKVPYMNSGLFECLDTFKLSEEGRLVADMYYDGFSSEGVRDKRTGRFTRRAFIPNMLFFAPEHEERITTNRAEKEKSDLKVQGIINILEEYNFTIEENTPSDVHVSLDPELLGRVFEELLAAYDPESGTTLRKATGSFYTPREIVDYMVEESLIAHLTHIYPGKEEGIRVLVKHNELSEEEVEGLDKEGIKAALYGVKILDPACGSGAFPMGCLLKICSIIQTLDREEYNSYETKLRIIQNCIYGVDIQPVAMLITKLRFFITLLCEQTPDMKNEKENYGINPLPNLDTRFVAANTLLPPDIKEFDDDRWNDEKMVELRNELFEIRKKVFMSRTKSSNKRYMREDIEKRNEIKRYICSKYSGPDAQHIKMLQQSLEQYRRELEDCQEPNYQDETEMQPSLFGDEVPQTLFSKDLNEPKRKELQKRIKMCEQQIDAEYKKELGDAFDRAVTQITYWNPFDQNMTSPFFDAEWMFDVREGFDIVIGNPPYIQLQADGGALGNLYKPMKFETFAQTGDIYCLFYEYGMRILRNSGVLSFITSNKWMRAAYGEKTRQFFAEKTNPVLLIDFAGMRIFQNATVETNILLLTKEQNRKATKCVVGKSEEKDVVSRLDNYVDENNEVLGFSDGDKWIISTGPEASIKRKINERGIALKDWNISIFRGVLTGFNDAFVITTEQREEILSRCRSEEEKLRTEELIVPTIRGRDIKHYSYQWANLWLINTHNGLKQEDVNPVDINDYPAIKEHLDKYWDEISKRGDKGVTPYNLRNCAYLRELEKPKLVWKRIGSILRFAYNDDGACVLDSTCFATGEHIEYLCCVLNSKMGHYLLKDSPKTGTGDLLVSVQAIEPIKVPKPDKETEDWFKSMLNQIIENPSSVLEEKIDEMVYKLYGLTDEEIAIVENSTK